MGHKGDPRRPSEKHDSVWKPNEEATDYMSLLAIAFSLASIVFKVPFGTFKILFSNGIFHTPPLMS